MISFFFCFYKRDCYSRKPSKYKTSVYNVEETKWFKQLILSLIAIINRREVTQPATLNAS